jgi:hypothetical protein
MLISGSVLIVEARQLNIATGNKPFCRGWCFQVPHGLQDRIQVRNIFPLMRSTQAGLLGLVTQLPQGYSLRHLDVRACRQSQSYSEYRRIFRRKERSFRRHHIARLLGPFNESLFLTLPKLPHISERPRWSFFDIVSMRERIWASPVLSESFLCRHRFIASENSQGRKVLAVSLPSPLLAHWLCGKRDSLAWVLHRDPTHGSCGT